MCPINVAKRKESSSKLEKERKENAGFHERLVLVNVIDSAGDYRIRRVHCSIGEAERVGARKESHVLRECPPTACIVDGTLAVI